jgi:DHA2 family multidrug resistance protein-like MFS transporter
VYRLQTAHTFPAGVSSQTAAAARDSLAGAASAAARLHDRTGWALLEAARQAFTHGLNAAALAGVAIAAALALLAVVMLRRPRITAEVAVPVKDSSSSREVNAALTGELACLTPQPCR